jgi:hypothetical protein
VGRSWYRERGPEVTDVRSDPKLAVGRYARRATSGREQAPQREFKQNVSAAQST